VADDSLFVTPLKTKTKTALPVTTQEAPSNETKLQNTIAAVVRNCQAPGCLALATNKTL